MNENRQIVKIQLDMIEPDPGQPRKTANKDTEYLRGLGMSIKSHGLNNPIHVRRDPENIEKYILVNGECRWAGSLLVGMSEIDAIIREDLSDATPDVIYLDQIVDNEARRGLDPVERIQSFQRGLELGIDADTLAARLGVSIATLSADLPILSLSPELLKMFDSGTMPKEIARRLAELKGTAQNKAWAWAKNEKNAKNMLIKIQAYVDKDKQKSLWAEEKKAAETPEEKKAAGKAWDALQVAFNNFAKSPYSNGSGHIMIKSRSRKLNELEDTAARMIAAANKILADAKAFRAQDKHAVL